MNKLVTAALVAILMGESAAAMAQPPESRMALSIAAQPVGDALNDLARQTGLQVVLYSEVGAGLMSPPLRGQYTAEEAIDRLLAGTGLSHRFLDNKTVTVVAAAASSKPTADISRPGTLRLAQATTESQPEAASSAASQSERAEPAASAADSRSGEPAGNMGEVVVTGSRIRRTNFDTPTPVASIDAAAVQSSGFNDVGEVLQRSMPAIGIGRGSASSHLTGEAGQNFVSLRNLGTNRTLVLVNGRRRVSGSTLSSAVDLTTIPDALIERVEVITGGASAVYGADAVTGVVNLVLKKDFHGLTATGNYGVSERGGAGNQSFTILAGTRFNEDRGSLSFSVSHSKTDPLHWSQRRNLGPGLLQLLANPDNTGPNDGIPDLKHFSNVRLAGLSEAGTFVLNNTRYTFDPQLRPVVHDSSPFGQAAYRGIGGDGWNWPDYDDLRVGFKRLAFNSYLTYELPAGVSFYMEGEFANSKTVNYVQPGFDLDLAIRRDNPFVSDALGTLMDTNGLQTITLSRAHRDQGIRNNFFDRDTFTVVTGFTGAFSNGWKYDLSYQYGRYDLDETITHSRIEQRFRQAVDAVADPVTGQPVCRDAAARAAGCVALDLFGPNAATPAAVAYFDYSRRMRSTNDQQVAAVNLTGDLFALPYGPLQFSAGAEYRKETSDYADDGMSVANLLWVYDNGGSNLEGEFDVKEGYVELLAPLLKDKPFIRELSLEGAVRYSDYSTIGNTTAWRLGGSWAPVSDLRVRAVRSRSVRAPNINELFSTTRKTLNFNDDPCDVSRIDLNPNRRANCAALGVPEGHIDQQQIGQDVLVGGNPDLGPERSNSWSVGLVLTPSALAGFSASVDYWKIKIDDAVSSLPPDTILTRCVDLPTIDNAFCPFITRREDSQVTSVTAKFFNIGGLLAEGIDFQTVYLTEPGALFAALPGRFRVALSGTYLRKNELQADATDDSSTVIRDGEVTSPRLRANLGLGYATRGNVPINVELTTRYISRSKVDVQLFSEENRDRNVAAAYFYEDLTFGAELSERYQVRFGVNNLFDKMPPRMAETYKGTYDGALYDNIGRFYFVGATAKF